MELKMLNKRNLKRKVKIENKIMARGDKVIFNKNYLITIG